MPPKHDSPLHSALSDGAETRNIKMSQMQLNHTQKFQHNVIYSVVLQFYVKYCILIQCSKNDGISFYSRNMSPIDIGLNRSHSYLVGQSAILNKSFIQLPFPLQLWS